MKIAFFNDTYHPYISGVIAAMDRFTVSLRKCGHEVALVVPGHWTPPWKDEPDEDVHELPSIPVPGFDGLRIGTPLLAEGHLTVGGKIDRDVDVVHAHSPFIVGRVGARLAEKRRLPLVFTCHSIYPRYSDYVPLVSDLAADVIQEYVAEFCSFCDVILAPSQFVRRTLRRWGVDGQIEILPSGVDVDQVALLRRNVLGDRLKIRADLCRPLGIGDDCRILLFVGRLDPQKNVGFLLEVMAALGGDLDEHLVVLGDGPARQNIMQSVQRMGLEDRVHLAGKRSFDEVVRWYCISDVFCFPSTTETQGLVVVESMAAGLPVVALSSPSSREIIQNERDGLLTANSVADFASAVKRLLVDDNWYRVVSENGINKAADYSVSSLTDRLVDIYRAAIHVKRSGVLS